MYRELYWKLVVIFRGYGIVTQAQALKIARIGGRKTGYWARHVLDLCEFALWKMQDLNVKNAALEKICTDTIAIVKKEKE